MAVGWRSGYPPDPVTTAPVSSDAALSDPWIAAELLPGRALTPRWTGPAGVVANLAALPLLMINDSGKRKLSATTADVPAEAIMCRYERASMIVTSDGSVGDCGNVLGDTAAVSPLRPASPQRPRPHLTPAQLEDRTPAGDRRLELHRTLIQSQRASLVAGSEVSINGRI
jgi:hypothetical protein